MDASDTPFFGEEGIFRRLFRSGSDKSIGNKRSESFQNVSGSLLGNLKHASGRSSCPEVFYKKGVLKNFAKFTGKHQCQRLFLIKLLAEACNFIKKRLWYRCFLMGFAKI